LKFHHKFRLYHKYWTNNTDYFNQNFNQNITYLTKIYASPFVIKTFAFQTSKADISKQNLFFITEDNQVIIINFEFFLDKKAGFFSTKKKGVIFLIKNRAFFPIKSSLFF